MPQRLEFFNHPSEHRWLWICPNYISLKDNNIETVHTHSSKPGNGVWSPHKAMVAFIIMGLEYASSASQEWARWETTQWKKKIVSDDRCARVSAINAIGPNYGVQRSYGWPFCVKASELRIFPALIHFCRGIKIIFNPRVNLWKPTHLAHKSSAKDSLDRDDDKI